MSHMRSYSTLLGHLLGSHPQIAGYAEQQHGYRTVADLIALRYEVWSITNGEARGDFVFDKVLHNKWNIADEILDRRDVLPIYGLREPIGSLRSLVAMGRRGRPSWRSDPVTASRHIFNRYEALVELAQRHHEAAALFMDSIISDTARTLGDLTLYLGLGQPLQATYNVLPMTGIGGYGDPVGPIEARKIVADRPEHDVEIPASLAGDLADAYRATSDSLRAHCTTVIGSPSAVR